MLLSHDELLELRRPDRSPMVQRCWGVPAGVGANPRRNGRGRKTPGCGWSSSRIGV